MAAGIIGGEQRFWWPGHTEKVVERGLTTVEPLAQVPAVEPLYSPLTHAYWPSRPSGAARRRWAWGDDRALPSTARGPDSTVGISVKQDYPTHCWYDRYASANSAPSYSPRIALARPSEPARSIQLHPPRGRLRIRLRWNTSAWVMPGTEPQSSSNGTHAQRLAPGTGATSIAAANRAPPTIGIQDGAWRRCTHSAQNADQFRSEIHAPVKANRAQSVHGIT